jgi:hypothetical protein
MQFMTYAPPPSDHRPDERAAEKAMRKNKDTVYTSDFRITSVSPELDLLIAHSDDDLEFYLSPPLLPSAVETFAEGQVLRIQYKGQLAPRVLKVGIAGT